MRMPRKGWQDGDVEHRVGVGDPVGPPSKKNCDLIQTGVFFWQEGSGSMSFNLTVVVMASIHSSLKYFLSWLFPLSNTSFVS